MSGETNFFFMQNEETHSKDSFLRVQGASGGSEPSNSAAVGYPNLYSAKPRPQCTSTTENEPLTIALPVTAWPMFLEKYLRQAREISKRLHFSSSSSIDDHSWEPSFGKSVNVETETMVTSSCSKNQTPTEAKGLPENKFAKQQIKQDELLTSTEKKSSSKKEENCVERQLQIFTRRRDQTFTITAPLQRNKFAAPEEAELALSVNSVTTVTSLNSTKCHPKKRHYSISPSSSEEEVSRKNENMVVSVLNATSNNLLSKQTLKSSLEWRSPPHNSSSETDQPTCLLNFDACDQRRHSSPVQNDEESSSYGSEMGGENLSPPQENSRSSTSEEMGASLFPISGFGSTSNCAEYLNSDEKDSQQSSPPYFQDDDIYQTTTRGGTNNNKPKQHKCRSCGFTTTNKHESWEHIAQHMKPEKILRCTKCPFVTEYKHHLDFHMWNHEGKKPFKCDKCAYECVNKSMLKSHSKSHSSVFPFQCESCGYKTKYCHSMKIHLRRQKHHQPKAVLDEDGNPDPTLFIDIHSNRRGPKQKNRKSADAQQRQQQRQQQRLQQQHLQLQLQQEQQLAPPPHLQNPPPPPFTHPPPLATLALGQFTSYSAWPDKVFPNETAPLGYPILSQPMESDNDEIFIPDSCMEEKPTPLTAAPFYLSPYEPLPLPLTIPPLPPSRLMEPKEEPEEAPLNLCPQTAEAPLNLSLSHNSSPTTESNPGSSSSSSSASGSTPAVKNRRKGVACKLKRIAYPDASAAEDGPVPVAQSISSGASTGGDLASLDHSLENAVTESQSEAENEIAGGLRNKSSGYYCEYCEISFNNQIMFTLHKGCHGFSDPFTCNRCGTKTDNKIDFYAHMISVAHMQ